MNACLINGKGENISRSVVDHVRLEVFLLSIVEHWQGASIATSFAVKYKVDDWHPISSQ